MAGRIWKPLRTRQIEAVASIIVDNYLIDDPAYVRQINAETGWAFDLTPTDPGAEALGHVIRHEAVVLSDQELGEALHMASMWSEQPGA